MDSRGPSGKPAEPAFQWFDLLGTVIALFTLFFPLFVIARYSEPPTGKREPALMPTVISETY